MSKSLRICHKHFPYKYKKIMMRFSEKFVTMYDEYEDKINKIEALQEKIKNLEMCGLHGSVGIMHANFNLGVLPIFQFPSHYTKYIDKYGIPENGNYDPVKLA